MCTHSFVFDENTEKAIDTLKVEFGASSKADVIRKALRLAYLAQRFKDDDKILTILDKGRREVKVVL